MGFACRDLYLLPRGLVRVATVVLFCLLWNVSAYGGELSLQPHLRTEINALLATYDGLHAALVSRQDEQIEIRIRDVIRQIERARSFLSFAKPHERSHLRLLLESAHGRLELAQTAFGDQRRAYLEEAINAFVNLVRIYRVDRSYGIFFCAKDRKSWVQKGASARNPFLAPAARECGFRVRD